MTSRLAGLTGATLETAPVVCQSCVWWQARGNREPDKRKWIERAETEWGAWGSVYRDDDGRVLGAMQYGPAGLFPKAADLPAGPPSGDAVLVTCAYLLSESQPWVEQSLFLAAIGEARDKGARALEAFAYRYREGTPPAERFLVHRTVFPRDFLADFGFRTLRTSGRIELARLELGGLVTVEEGAREKVLKIVRDALSPTPAPAPPGEAVARAPTPRTDSFQSLQRDQPGPRAGSESQARRRRGPFHRPGGAARSSQPRVAIGPTACGATPEAPTLRLIASKSTREAESSPRNRRTKCSIRASPVPPAPSTMARASARKRTMSTSGNQAAFACSQSMTAKSASEAITFAGARSRCWSAAGTGGIVTRRSRGAPDSTQWGRISTSNQRRAGSRASGG
jgi:hypothetical protein